MYQNEKGRRQDSHTENQDAQTNIREYYERTDLRYSIYVAKWCTPFLIQNA